jgi:hypothetical protein
MAPVLGVWSKNSMCSAKVPSYSVTGQDSWRWLMLVYMGTRGSKKICQWLKPTARLALKLIGHRYPCTLGFGGKLATTPPKPSVQGDSYIKTTETPSHSRRTKRGFIFHMGWVSVFRLFIALAIAEGVHLCPCGTRIHIQSVSPQWRFMLGN